MEHDNAFAVIFGLGLLAMVASLFALQLAEPGQPVVSVMRYLTTYYMG